MSMTPTFLLLWKYITICSVMGRAIAQQPNIFARLYNLLYTLTKGYKIKNKVLAHSINSLATGWHITRNPTASFSISVILQNAQIWLQLKIRLFYLLY